MCLLLTASSTNLTTRPKADRGRCPDSQNLFRQRPLRLRSAKPTAHAPSARQLLRATTLCADLVDQCLPSLLIPAPKPGTRQTPETCKVLLHEVAGALK